jgi:hypothetical protein
LGGKDNGKYGKLSLEYKLGNQFNSVKKSQAVFLALRG